MPPKKPKKKKKASETLKMRLFSVTIVAKSVFTYNGMAKSLEEAENLAWQQFGEKGLPRNCVAASVAAASEISDDEDEPGED